MKRAISSLPRRPLTCIQILQDCVIYVEYRNAKTVTVQDVSIFRCADMKGASTNPANRSSTAWAVSGDLSGASTLRHIIPKRTETDSFPFMAKDYTWSSERHVKAYVVFRFVLSVIVEVLYQVVYTCARRICTISHKA